jgi:hypothetical protein
VTGVQIFSSAAKQQKYISKKGVLPKAFHTECETETLLSFEFLLGNHGKDTARSRSLDRDISSIVCAMWRCHWDVELKGALRLRSKNEEVYEEAGGEVIIGCTRAQTVKRDWKESKRRSTWA